MWYEAKAMLLIPCSVSLPHSFSFILKKASKALPPFTLNTPSLGHGGRLRQSSQEPFHNLFVAKIKEQKRKEVSLEEYLWVFFFLFRSYSLCWVRLKFLLPFSPKSWSKVLEVENAMGILLSLV